MQYTSKKITIPHVYENIKYGRHHPNKCLGTVAFKCRNNEELLTQISCHFCRQDWISTNNGTNTGKKPIQWRYDEDIGKLIIAHSKEPVYYFEYVQLTHVHEFHHTRTTCQGLSENCCTDLSFLNYSRKFHICNPRPYTNSKGSDTRGLQIKSAVEYHQKNVVLTISRDSSNSSDVSNLHIKHPKKYDIVRDILIRNNFQEQSIIYGQRYHKRGQLETTIVGSNYGGKDFSRFCDIASNINEDFYMGSKIFIMLRVPGDFCSSPYYIKEFFKTITSTQLQNIYFVLLNWVDDGKLEDDIEIVIKASYLMFLFQEETLYPFEYFHRDNEKDLEDDILNKVSDKTKATWNFIKSFGLSHLQRSNTAPKGRNK